MDISEISKEIYDFQVLRTSEFGADLTPELVFLHLTEEIGEIARQLVNKRIPKFRSYDLENTKEEVVQSMLDILVLARLLEIDLPVELKKKIDQMKKRRLENPV